MKKLSITVRGDTLEELAGNVVALGAELNSLGANSAPVKEAAPGKSTSAQTGGSGGSPAAKGKGATKSGKPAEEPGAQDDDLGFGEEAAAGDDLGLDDVPPPPPPAPKGPTKDDVIVAIRDFVKKDREKNKPKVEKMLANLKIKSVQDIPEKEFSRILDILKKK